MDTNNLIDTNEAMAEALAFCKNPDGSDNRWLVDADPWFAKAMTLATTDVGFDKDPDPVRAIVVASNSFSYSEPGAATVYGWREWRYVSELNGKPLGGVDMLDRLPISNCHRCDSLDTWTQKRAQATLCIPRGRYVVEFAFCRDCMVSLALLVDR